MGIKYCLYKVHQCMFIGVFQASSGEHLRGTAWWMAPELVRSGILSAQATKKSDIW